VEFSEGKSITKEDEKTYVGNIIYEDEDGAPEGDHEPKGNIDSADSNEVDDSHKERRLLVKGSVIYGYGLEPVPVGRFIMSETSGSEYDDEEDEYDDDEEPDEDIDSFSDWSSAFQ
jgi:hypothetical protein